MSKTISGNVTDAKTGESLPYANIYLSDASGKYIAGTPGTITNPAGNYTLIGENTHITASYTGYARQTKPYSNWVNFKLEPESYLLPEANVVGKRIVKNWQYLIILVIAIAAGIYIAKRK